MIMWMLRRCEAVRAAAPPGTECRQKDLYIGTDVEFAPQQDDNRMRAAVVQFAMAGFVVIIPLEVATRPAVDKPPGQRAVLVRPSRDLPFARSPMPDFCCLAILYYTGRSRTSPAQMCALI